MKNYRLWAALLVIPLIEVAVTIVATKYLGVAWTYALFAVSTLLGLMVQFYRWPQTKQLLKQSATELDVYRDDENKLGRPQVFDPFAEWVLFWVSCLLFLIPGFATDILAFALMLPPFKQRILAHLFDFVKPRLPRL